MNEEESAHKALDDEELEGAVTEDDPVLPTQTTSISNRGCSLRIVVFFVTLKIVVAPQT